MIDEYSRIRIGTLRRQNTPVAARYHNHQQLTTSLTPFARDRKAVGVLASRPHVCVNHACRRCPWSRSYDRLPPKLDDTLSTPARSLRLSAHAPSELGTLTQVVLP